MKSQLHCKTCIALKYLEIKIKVAVYSRVDAGSKMFYVYIISRCLCKSIYIGGYISICILMPMYSISFYMSQYKITVSYNFFRVDY